MEDKEIESLIKIDLEKITPSKNFSAIKSALNEKGVIEETPLPEEKKSFKWAYLTPVAASVLGFAIATPILVNVFKEDLYCDASVKLNISNSLDYLSSRIEVKNDLVTFNDIYAYDDNASLVLNSFSNEYQSSFLNTLSSFSSKINNATTKEVEIFAKNDVEIKKISAICKNNGYQVKNETIIEKEDYRYIEKVTRIYDIAYRLYRFDDAFNINELSISNIIKGVKDKLYNLDDLYASYSSYNSLLNNNSKVKQFNDDSLSSSGETTDKPLIIKMEEYLSLLKAEKDAGPEIENYFK